MRTRGWVYSELLADEREEIAASFWLRVNAWFATNGIIVRKILTDNGSYCRSHAIREAMSDIEHCHGRHYRPQNNGKVERIHPTFVDEWPTQALHRRRTMLPGVPARWPHTYNRHRARTRPSRTARHPIARRPNRQWSYATRR